MNSTRKTTWFLRGFVDSVGWGLRGADAQKFDVQDGFESDATELFREDESCPHLSPVPGARPVKGDGRIAGVAATAVADDVVGAGR